jgi:predicted secreted protein
MQRLLFSFFLFILFLSQTAAAEPIYSITDKTSSIRVTAKQPQFTLHLKSNATTGYVWVLRDSDAELVKLVKHTYQAGVEKRLGTPGIEAWTFQIKPAKFLIPQQTLLCFEYVRPWEQSSASSRQLVVKVTIPITPQDAKF